MRTYNFIFDLDGKNNGEKELEAVLFRTDFDRTEKTPFAIVKMELEQSMTDRGI